VSAQSRHDSVIIDADFHQPGERMTLLYGNLGGATDVAIEPSPTPGDPTLHVRLDLAPHQFVILA
jgi:hypothetical protein